MGDASTPEPLDDAELDVVDAWWRAANYLTVGQIYLQANPLLHHPLDPAHIKPRLLGHWGTSPGLSFLYAHLNRVIRRDELDMIFVAGPGHGGPALVANTYLEGSYTDVYPHISRDIIGLQRLFRQFSTPGGIPSHVSVPTPGSIHEGGELGYALVHAFGAVFDNPNLIVACVVGDGEAETGPLEGSWKGTRFLNPARDGAVLPILHLNGYKISGPTVLGRAPRESVAELLSAHGYQVHLVAGDDPAVLHQRLAGVLDECLDAIGRIQQSARTGRTAGVGALAGHRPGHPQGLDRAQGGRRRGRRGHLPGPPGAAGQRPRQPRSPGPARDLDALVPTRGALRRQRSALARLRSPHPTGGPAHGGQPPGQRRPASPAPLGAGLAVLRGRDGRPGPRAGGVDPPVGRVAARRVLGQRRSRDLPPVLPRRDELQPAGRGVRGERPVPGGDHRDRPTTTSRPTVGSWRC